MHTPTVIVSSPESLVIVAVLVYKVEITPDEEFNSLLIFSGGL